MTGARLRRLAQPHVAKLGLDAFDLEPHQRAVGESENDHAGGWIGLFERHRKKVEHRALVGIAQSETGDLQHPVETKKARHTLLPPRLRANPVITHPGDDEAALTWQPHHVGALDAGILRMGGYDAEALTVERDEFERLGGGHRF